MKRTKLTAALGVLAFSMAVASPALAKKKKRSKKKGANTEMMSDSKVSYGMAGCGLGTMVMKKDTMFNQLLSMTTSGYTGTQLFGITTGTSGCDGYGPAAGGSALRLEEQRVFVANNLSTLERESAQGQGDTLRSLAAVSGCEADAFGEFAAMSQASHAELFASADATIIVDTLNKRISESSDLASACD